MFSLLVDSLNCNSERTVALLACYGMGKRAHMFHRARAKSIATKPTEQSDSCESWQELSVLFRSMAPANAGHYIDCNGANSTAPTVKKNRSAVDDFLWATNCCESSYRLLAGRDSAVSVVYYIRRGRITVAHRLYACLEPPLKEAHSKRASRPIGLDEQDKKR